jgi:hypothetical protein
MIGLKMKKEMKDVEATNTSTSAGHLQFKKGISWLLIFAEFNFIKTNKS